MSSLGLLPLFAWLSPAFPVGAFAYSHGLEQAVADGDVCDAATLAAWLTDLIEHGSVRNDLILAACAARARGAATEDGGSMGVEDWPRFAEVAELALALSPSRERHLETAQQGRSFLEAMCAAWPSPPLGRILASFREIAYPVAFGAAVAAHGVEPRQALSASALQFVSNLVSAVVRLGVVGQTDGQRIVASFAGKASAAADAAARSDLDDLGGAAFRSDLASIRHETKYSRVFRS